MRKREREGGSAGVHEGQARQNRGRRCRGSRAGFGQSRGYICAVVGRPQNREP